MIGIAIFRALTILNRFKGTATTEFRMLENT